MMLHFGSTTFFSEKISNGLADWIITLISLAVVIILVLSMVLIIVCYKYWVIFFMMYLTINKIKIFPLNFILYKENKNKRRQRTTQTTSRR